MPERNITSRAARPFERTKGPTGGGPPRGRRLRSPSPVADTARCTRSASHGPHRIAKHNPPKRADNQMDRARVLEVRIHLPPAESQVRTCLSREFAFLRREAAVSRGCAGWGER